MGLVERKDLMFGGRGVFAGMKAWIIMRLFGLRTINRMAADMPTDGALETGAILKWLEIGYSVGDHDRANIPTTGPAIVISNHPTGMPDGVMILDMIMQVRPDVKFLSNYLLERIEFLRQYFIYVDPFDSRDQKRNVRGLLAARRHLQHGGVLVLFPSGEVSTWQKGFGRVKDKPWIPSMMRFIQNAAVPVVPVCIEGRNSLIFHLAGKIHPSLRTALLPRQMLNKRGQVIPINIGAPLTPKRLEDLTDLQIYSDYLRANVDYLTHKRPRRKLRIIAKRKPAEVVAEEITLARSREFLSAELAEIRGRYLLFEYGAYEIFFAPSREIPNMMHEIGRMREVTFREIGEGSMKSIDTDNYDEYYHQLFIWDKKEGALVGAYRMGLGREIMPRYGLRGFYTDSLFRYSPEMASIMEKSIELGRSFVTPDYQRKAVTLMLLWKGIMYVLLKHDEYRNLMGPVTISGELQSASKVVIVNYLRQHHYDAKMAAWVHPVTGLEGISAPIDPALVEGVEDIDLINKLVTDIERDEFSIPVLIRKYLQVKSRVLGFNVDHDFNNGLDALILLDLKKVPEETIAMLSRDIAEIDVRARLHNL